MTYFDYNSTAPYSPSVRKYIEGDFVKDWHNPSSFSFQSEVLSQKIKECRKVIAEHLNCSAKHLFFTSGATESINTVLSLESLKLNALSSVISSPLEHSATLKKIEQLTSYKKMTLDSIETHENLTGDKKFTIDDIKSNQSLKNDKKFEVYEKKLEENSLGGKNPAFYKEKSKQNSMLDKALELYQTQRDQKNINSFSVSLNTEGEIDLNHLEELASQNSYSLISLLSANNETGVITDIPAISKIAKKHNCLVHVDAVQSLGKQAIDLEKWDVDFASFSGHKIGAMKGIGLLYATKPLAPLLIGGGQEKGLRPGTYNYPAIQSFKLAVQDIDLKKQEEVKKLRDDFENQLLSLKSVKNLSVKLPLNTTKEINSSLPLSSHKEINSEAQSLALKLDKEINSKKSQDVSQLSQGSQSVTEKTLKVNCQKAPRLANTSNLYCGGLSNQVILLKLYEKGICVSTGSACNSGSPEPSHVLTAIAQKENSQTDKSQRKTSQEQNSQTDKSQRETSQEQNSQTDKSQRKTSQEQNSQTDKSQRKTLQKQDSQGQALQKETSSYAKDYARSCLRISLAPSSTKEEIDLLVKSLKELF